jgi:hypothetical protein
MTREKEQMQSEGKRTRSTNLEWLGIVQGYKVSYFDHVVTCMYPLDYVPDRRTKQEDC